MQRDSEFANPGILYLLGQTVDGIIRQADRLSDRTGGCADVPSHTNKELTHLYGLQAKKGLTTVAFAHVINWQRLQASNWVGHGPASRAWPSNFGLALYNNANIPFVQFYALRPPRAIMYDLEINQVIDIPLTLI